MNQILRALHQGAKARGYEVSLTPEQIVGLMSQPCRYCGTMNSNLSSHPEYHGTFAYNGIDRVDNSLGYTIDNVVPCCKHCNIAKRDRTTDQFLAWIARVFEHSVASH